MKDFVKKESETISSGSRPVRLEYRERRDGKRAQVVIDQLPVEEGLPGRIHRRYHRLIAAQRRQKQSLRHPDLQRQ